MTYTLFKGLSPGLCEITPLLLQQHFLSAPSITNLIILAAAKSSQARLSPEHLGLEGVDANSSGFIEVPNELLQKLTQISLVALEEISVYNEK